MPSTSNTTSKTSTKQAFTNPPVEKKGRGRPRVYPRDEKNRVIRPPGAPKVKYTARKTETGIEKETTKTKTKNTKVSAQKREDAADADVQAGPSKKQKSRGPGVSLAEIEYTPEPLMQAEEVSNAVIQRSPTPEIISITADTIFLDTLEETCFKPCSDEFWAIAYSKEGKGRQPHDTIRWTTHPRHVRETASLMRAMRPQFCRWMENEWWPEEMKRLASVNVEKMMDEAWVYSSPDYEMVAEEAEWKVFEVPFDL
ncbi:hypothetical protein N0V95_008261 [Ascochyta clinopodiicola]|nr:hypothetical protein N0V95_008261 [Ascochyta clinopodiicola]